jgi:hypothetical protein
MSTLDTYSRFARLTGQWHGEETTYRPGQADGVRAVTCGDHQLTLRGRFVLADHIQHPIGTVRFACQLDGDNAYTLSGTRRSPDGVEHLVVSARFWRMVQGGSSYEHC